MYHQCDPSTTIFHPEPEEWYDEYGNDYVLTQTKRECACCGRLRTGFKTVIGDWATQYCRSCVRIINDKTGYA